ncbi:phage tail assembly protein T [Allopusillimonas ginsengisoli]|uniref:phage tail assembly protein T n=1 Tax=Allopusillimonas ginsengisoli TaxID=453575 RepID=UPI001021579A|nr:DUF4035 domain-containing protein [Allopusillimonas ginsengisoli]TEA79838.1 DUF4035 domain-containing protein [Allopusillimonas ginsengisoli]
MIELSLALGKTLEELRDMSESDFRLYQQYYAKQPFGQWRADYNAARIAQSMAGGKLQDLMPFWFDDEEAANEEAFDELIAGAISI